MKDKLKGPIIFVEDNYTHRTIPSKVLEERGYFVIGYSNGREAIENIKNELKYKLAIVDLSLPEPVSGEEVIRESKKLNPEVPVISTSGFQLSGYLHKLGSDMHLLKPFWPDKLFEAIDSLYPVD